MSRYCESKAATENGASDSDFVLDEVRYSARGDSLFGRTREDLLKHQRRIRQAISTVDYLAELHHSAAIRSGDTLEKIIESLGQIY